MTDRQAKYVELTELVLRAAEGDLDAADHARLEAMLAGDAQARTDYADLMMTVCTLDWRAGAETHAARAADSAIGQVLLTGVIDRQREELSRRMLEEEEQHRLQQAEAEIRRLRAASQRPDVLSDHRVIVIPKALVWLGLAAVIALVASVVWFNRPAPTPTTQPEAVASNPRSGVGHLSVEQPVRVARVAAVLDARWADGRGVEANTAVFDRPIELASGIIELEMTSGVSLTIEAPARLVPTSDMLVTLDRGKLVGHVPELADGFTIRTDTMEVVGLGAEVAIESGGTRGSAMHVLRGTVRLEPGRSSQAFEPVQAVVGEASVVRAGHAPTAIASQPSAFYRHVPGAYERRVRDAEPLAYWRFNEVDGDGVLAGLGAANAALAGVWTSDLSPDCFPGGEPSDQALQLSGRRSITSDALSGLDVAAGFTVEAWVFVPSGVDRRMRIIANNELDADGRHIGGLGFGVSGLPEDVVGGPTLHFTGFSVFDATSRSPLPTDQWVHVAASMDGEGRLAMYIDGRLVAHRIADQAGVNRHRGGEGRLFIPPSRSRTLIGDARVGVGVGTEHWSGGIDELVVYDWVLDSEEIVAHATLELDRD
ncbi:LamG domain-containing protein [Phycisphaeraceae bacterium D3-23]